MVIAAGSLTWAGVGAAVLIAVVVALITGWAQSFTRWLGRVFVDLVRSRRQPDDHFTIGSGRLRVDGGGWPRYHVHVRCAPSQQWPQARRMNVDAVRSIVREAFPGVFPDEADYAVPDELVRFMTSPVPGEQYDPAQLCCTPQGVVEVALPIDHDLDNSGEPVIRAVAIANVIVGLHGAVVGGLYQKIYEIEPKRLDWMMNVSPNITGPSAPRPWRAVAFPRSVPEGRGTGAMPSSDVLGYGRDKTRSLPSRIGIHSLLTLTFTDFLERNSYRGFQNSVADMVEAAAP
jgi:hypothetical protein